MAFSLNCLRALRATSRNPVTASAFCTSYISSSPGTVTVTSSTVTTTTPAQVTITISEVTTTTVGPTDFVVTITPATVTVALNQGFQKRKRDLAATLPRYLTPGCNPTGTTSAAARISSACSCFLTSATTTATAVRTVTAPALKPPTVFTSTSTSTEYIYTATVTSEAPTPTISTCVSQRFNDFSDINDGVYLSAQGTFPAPGITNKIDCCNACYLGQGCYKFQFSDPAPATGACTLYQILSAPNPSSGRPPTARCPRGYGSASQFGVTLGGDVGSTMEIGPCIDQSQK